MAWSDKDNAIHDTRREFYLDGALGESEFPPESLDPVTVHPDPVVAGFRGSTRGDEPEKEQHECYDDHVHFHVSFLYRRGDVAVEDPVEVHVIERGVRRVQVSQVGYGCRPKRLQTSLCVRAG